MTITDRHQKVYSRTSAHIELLCKEQHLLIKSCAAKAGRKMSWRQAVVRSGSEPHLWAAAAGAQQVHRRVSVWCNGSKVQRSQPSRIRFISLGNTKKSQKSIVIHEWNIKWRNGDAATSRPHFPTSCAGVRK